MAMRAVGAKDEDRRLAARLLAPVLAGAQNVALGLAPRIRWAQDLAAAGLSPEEIADELLGQLPEQLPVIAESGEEESPRETALKIVRGLLDRDVPEPGPGGSRVDYPGVTRL
jgi:hypothetical protein